jgi:hypothetical protein
MKRNKLFIDTDAWVALIVEIDHFHNKARTFMENLDASTKWFSANYVISEIYTC